MKVKRLLCLGMAAALLCSNLPQMTVHAQELVDLQQEKEYAAEPNEIISGKCGENVYYEFNPSTETMRIYGEGAMYDYNRYTEHPWHREEYAADIKKVRIEEGVTSVGKEAFYCFKNRYGEYDKYGCKNLTSVEIADTVTNIGAQAFNCCPIKSIGFPDGLETIGDGAFYNTSLTEIKWGSSLKNIGTKAFLSIDIWELILPPNVESIGYCCFESCNSLKKLTVPDNCQMDGSVFSYCQALEDVQIGSNCKIGGCAFECCDKLENIEIGFNCEVGGYAFNECNSLSNVSIGEGSIAVYDKNAPAAGNIFRDCISLETILLPDSWAFGEYGYGNQFLGCTNLTDIKFSDTSTKYKIIDKVIYSKDGSKIVYYPETLREPEYEIPDGTTAIVSGAFKGQDYLEYVTIPDSVQEIGAGAFGACSRLNNIIIPEGVQELRDGVFGSCDSLKTIVLPASLKDIAVIHKENGIGAFGETSLNVIYAEEGSYAREYAGDKFKQTIYCTFDADGGTVTPQKRPVIYNDKYHELPVPVKEGYKFLGWYTESGDKVTDKTMVSSENSHTLYAHWEVGSKKQITDCEITLSPGDYIYDGSEKKPTVTVRDGLAALTSGTDYSLTYSNNVKAGTATVTITGTGNYTGTASKTFIISAKPITGLAVTLEKTSYIYDGTAKQPSVAVKDGPATLMEGTDYAVSYSDNVDVGTAAVTVAGKGNYSGKTTKTFTINAQADDGKSFEWGKNNWRFDNSSRYFSNYDVNSDVMDKMQKDFNLSNSDIAELKWNIANDNASGFNGSCFGMTISEIMAYQGGLRLSRYGGSDVVNQNANTSDMTSVINFIQELQSNSEMCQSIRQTPFLSGKFPQAEFIRKLRDVAENSDYLVKLSYKIVTRNANSGSVGNGYHAVLVYGIEDSNYYSPVTGKTYDRKILIADPNYLSGNAVKSDACLYFKSSDCSWIVPYWNVRYANGTVQSCYWDAESGEATDNGGIRNIMRYESLTEEVDLMSGFNAGHYIAGLEIDNKSQNVSSVEKVKNSGNPNADYSGDFSDEIVRYDMDMDDNIYMTENDELYALWNPTSFYTLSYLKPSDYSLKMDYETVDYYADVTNSTYTLFKPGGSITLKGSDADYDIAMVTEDADCVTDWFSVAVSGTDVDNLVYAKVKGGYTLSASNLRNVKVSVKGEGFAADVSFSTEYDDVFIYEIDKETIGVKADTDKNGTYETQIPTEEAHQLTKGQKFTDRKRGAVYKVVSAKTKGGTVEYIKPLNRKAANVSIPSAVKINGVSYKVTGIAANAFKNNKVISKVKIGSNVSLIGDNAFLNCTSLKAVTIPAKVKKIGKQAFCGCKRLKTIKVGSKKLSDKNVGSKAFAKADPKAVVKAPASCLKSYKKLLQKRGLNGKKQRFQKI